MSEEGLTNLRMYGSKARLYRNVQELEIVVCAVK